MNNEKPPFQRAGTPLTRDASAKVQLTFEDERKGTTIHGTVDLNNRFYQAGGQFSDFFFRKHRTITMPQGIWDQLFNNYSDDVDYIEWYDREQNVAYRVHWVDAILFGATYEAGIGQRYGIPASLFTKTDKRQAVM